VSGERRVRVQEAERGGCSPKDKNGIPIKRREQRHGKDSRTSQNGEIRKKKEDWANAHLRSGTNVTNYVSLCGFTGSTGKQGL